MWPKKEGAHKGAPGMQKCCWESIASERRAATNRTHTAQQEKLLNVERFTTLLNGVPQQRSATEEPVREFAIRHGKEQSHDRS